MASVWHDEVKARLSGGKQDISFEFYHTDATKNDSLWVKEADVIFMNSTCFCDTLMSQLATSAEKLEAGTFVITTTRPLPSEAFEVLEETTMEESWGQATTYSKCVYIYMLHV